MPVYGGYISQGATNAQLAVALRYEALHMAVPGTAWDYTDAATRELDPSDNSIQVLNLDAATDGVGFGLMGIAVPAWATQAQLTFDYRHAASETGKVVDITYISRLAPAGAWGSEVATDDLNPPADETWKAETIATTLVALGWTAGQTYDLHIVRRTNASDTSGSDCYIRAVTVEFA